MADFHQNGIITTLHRLGERPIDALEAELRRFGRRRPMSLVLPCLYSELEGDALPAIVDQLFLAMRKKGWGGEDHSGLLRVLEDLADYEVI